MNFEILGTSTIGIRRRVNIREAKVEDLDTLVFLTKVNRNGVIRYVMTENYLSFLPFMSNEGYICFFVLVVPPSAISTFNLDGSILMELMELEYPDNDIAEKLLLDDESYKVCNHIHRATYLMKTTDGECLDYPIEKYREENLTKEEIAYLQEKLHSYILSQDWHNPRLTRAISNLLNIDILAEFKGKDAYLKDSFVLLTFPKG